MTKFNMARYVKLNEGIILYLKERHYETPRLIKIVEIKEIEVPVPQSIFDNKLRQPFKYKIWKYQVIGNSTVFETKDSSVFRPIRKVKVNAV